MPQATTSKAPSQSPVVATAPKAVTGPVSTPVPAPATRSDAAALQSRVGELKGQLDAATARRDRLAQQLRNAREGADRSGLEDRIGQLDKRILQIETDIADVGRALSAAPAGILQVTTTAPARQFGPPTPGQTTAISIVGTIFVLFPLAIAYARILWRRASNPPPPAAPPPELTARLERMEQGIEVIALEVERISEGQRFVAQLMSNNARQTPAGVPNLPGPTSRTA
jgi:hypothetical protein